MNNFKAGDKVRCVTNVGLLNKGEIYTVASTNDIYVFLKEFSLDYNGYYSARFELVIKPTVTKYVSDFDKSEFSNLDDCIAYDEEIANRFKNKEKNLKVANLLAQISFNSISQLIVENYKAIKAIMEDE